MPFGCMPLPWMRLLRMPLPWMPLPWLPLPWLRLPWRLRLLRGCISRGCVYRIRQRRYALQPRVARPALPWELITPHPPTPPGLRPGRGPMCPRSGGTALRFIPNPARSQGRPHFIRPTLGWRAESLWDRDPRTLDSFWTSAPCHGSVCRGPQLSTINSQPSTLNPQPSTLNSQLSTLPWLLREGIFPAGGLP